MNVFAVGHIDGTIAFYDKSTHEVIKTLKMPETSSNSSQTNQPNKMVCDPTSPLLVAGLDNGTIVCIDTSKYEICGTLDDNHGGEGIADLCLDG